MAKPSPTSRKTASARSTPLLEWVVAGLGLILTLGALGILAMDLGQPASPPELAARAVGITPVAAGFQVEVEVANAGRATAAGVEIEGVLTPPAGQPETATASLDYVPGTGAETLTLKFRADPRAGDLDLTVRGWSEP
ncbi:MAG: hypothetical protein M3Q74_09380 [Pseudomonadota bacterium]|nr:hypothetical protein [Pseudomonadota bacterium]